MGTNWAFFIDFALLSLLLGLATYLKRTFKIFQRYLVPDAIIAGFLGLILGSEVLNIIKLDPDSLGTLIYHLMAIGFIALSLKERKREQNKDVVNTGMYIVSTYLVQGIVGFGLTLILIKTIYPDLFPAFGLLLPLAYGQGPGQAFSIGTQWQAHGFFSGGNIGLTLATLGYLWASIGGVILMNYLIKRRKMQKAFSDKTLVKSTETVESIEFPPGGSIDHLTIQLFLIGIVYLITYGTLLGLSTLLSPLGTFGQTLSGLFWGFHFLIGALYAFLLRFIFDFLKKKKIMVHNYPNNYLLERISGGCFDFMITAAISAISISIVKEFIVPILLISLSGGIITVIYTIWIAKRIYKDYVLEYILALFGMLTGTISTGMALLREVDPNFQTQVAEKLVLGSGVGLLFGFPLLIILNIPIFGYLNDQPLMYLICLLVLIAYFGLLLFFMLRKRPISLKPKDDNSAAK